MRHVVMSAEGNDRSRIHWGRYLGSVLAGVFATCLMAAGFLGVSSSVASATTSSYTLTMTSGSFGVHSNTPTALSTPASIAGHVSSTTGNLTSSTLTIPAWHESNTGSSETIHLYESTSGSGTGTINYLGDMTYTDTLTIEVHITSPITQKCYSSPVDILLSSSSPYNTTTHDVTLTESNFSIPNFKSTTCSFAASTLDSKFSGSSGNVLTLNLHGTLPEPGRRRRPHRRPCFRRPRPARRSTGPRSRSRPQWRRPQGPRSTTATGTMKFLDGTTVLATVAVSGGTASYTTSTLATKTNKPTAKYTGDSGYKASTSAVPHM